ncbi:hypothetical protein BASA62_002879 [Batrachochytrium salamandrivorans]|nr:hypothetical protein BASA62_002879 [Batrachochytrium salamandrivorans]
MKQRSISSFFASKTDSEVSKQPQSTSSSPSTSTLSALQTPKRSTTDLERMRYKLPIGSSCSKSLTKRQLPLDLAMDVCMSDGQNNAQTRQLQEDTLINLDHPELLYSSQTSTVSGRSLLNTPIKRYKKSDSLTPLEQQFMDIKAAHPDCLLFVEVGYKYRFFGRRCAELGIVAFVDHSMATASIPVHRLEVHVKKLVHLGHKVGIVRQIETAAIKGSSYIQFSFIFVLSSKKNGFRDYADRRRCYFKREIEAAGDNKNAPFARKLVKIYTKGTMLFEMESCDDDGDGATGTAESGFLIALHERKVLETGDCQISMMAVQLATGTVVFDDFTDNFLRTELETRLSHMEPAELILPIQDLSVPTQKMIQLICSKLSGSGDLVRIEKVPWFDVTPDKAKLALMEKTVGSGALPDWVIDFPHSTFPCMLAVQEYLTQFGLQDLFQMQIKPLPFSQIGFMSLNANTISSLEIFRNQTDGSERGSLFESLNSTKTKFGRRLFRRWLSRPLVNIKQLDDRLKAVQEIKQLIADENPTMLRVRSIIFQLPDLEKGLARIFFGRSSPREVWGILFALKKIATMIKNGLDDVFQSRHLRTLLESMGMIFSSVESLLSRVSQEGAHENNQNTFFKHPDSYPEIAKWTQSELNVQQHLMDQLVNIRKLLKMPSLEYTTVNGIAFLIELSNKKLDHVPISWTKMSTTKTVSRFHSPDIIDLVRERNCILEELNAACRGAFFKFMREISDHFLEFRQAIQNAAEIDCLLSLSRLAENPLYVMPQFVMTPIIEAIDTLNPILHRICDNYVPNDISLDLTRRCLLITGPNMGGKSCYVKQVALICLMAQIGSYVPATSVTLGIFDSIHVRMGASDDLVRNQSTFMKELQETSDILARCTSRSLVILDELGRGTSTFDGTAIAYATLLHLVDSVRCMTLFVTHYPSLGSMCEEVDEGAIRNAHMGFLETRNQISGGVCNESSAMTSTQTCDSQIVFLHKLVDGASLHSYGVNVARMAGLPRSVLVSASAKSAEMQHETEQRIKAVRANDRMRSFVDLWRKTIL